MSTGSFLDPKSSHPFVHLLMATCDGGSYITEQLESLARQDYPQWRLTVSDDGSVDETLSLVKAFAQKVPQSVRIISGPRLGATRNFVHLIQEVNWINKYPSKDQNTDQDQDQDQYQAPAFAASDTDLFAFVDQDDVWLPNKLSRAVHWHENERLKDPRGLTSPLLYASTTQEVDAALTPRRVMSERLAKVELRLGFGGALTQNVISGNTMVMNGPLLKIYQKIDPSHSVWHDWTAYLVATGCGGLVYIDPEVSVLYRQHAQNVIGSQRGLKAQWGRLMQIPVKRYKTWVDINLAATRDIESSLTQASRELRDKFVDIRLASGAMTRMRKGLKSGLWRQSPLEQVAFIVGLGLGWV